MCAHTTARSEFRDGCSGHEQDLRGRARRSAIPRGRLEIYDLRDVLNIPGDRLRGVSYFLKRRQESVCACVGDLELCSASWTCREHTARDHRWGMDGACPRRCKNHREPARIGSPNFGRVKAIYAPPPARTSTPDYDSPFYDSPSTSPSSTPYAAHVAMSVVGIDFGALHSKVRGPVSSSR